MIEEHGDLWRLPGDARCITTNGAIAQRGTTQAHAVMGRGVALQAAQRWPDLPGRFAALLEHYGNRPMKLRQIGPMGCDGLCDGGPPNLCQRDEHRIKPGVWLVSYPVKHHWRERADMDLVTDSAVKLRDMADKFGWARVVIPRPGCGNGGLDWEFVRGVLVWILDDRFVVAIPTQQ